MLRRYQKLCCALSTGGMTLGILQGLELVNYSNVLATFLANFLSLLVSILFGGAAAL